MTIMLSRQRIFGHSKKIAAKYKRLPLDEERKLISLAKKGNVSARKKLLLHLIGFFIFRIETTLYPPNIRQFGEDILQECILHAIIKIQSYNLRYKNKWGRPQKFHFSTYLWKGITGLMLMHIKRNKREIRFFDSLKYDIEE